MSRSNAPAIRESQTPARQQASAANRTIALLEDPASMTEIRRALGSRGDVEKFVRAARSHYLHTSAADREAMAKVSPESYVAACIDCATNGLLPDGRMAYIYPRGAKAVFHPSWRGLVAMVRRATNLDIAAECVYERCRFRALLGSNRRLDHEPYYSLNVDDDERGDLIAAYATAEHEGKVVFRVLSRKQLDKRQALGGPVWRSHYEAMCMKSAIRALCDWLPLPDELREFIASDAAREGDAEGETVAQVGPRAIDTTTNAPTGDPATGWNGGQTSAAAIRSRGPKKTTPAPVDTTAKEPEPEPPREREPGEDSGELFDDEDGGRGQAP